MNSDNICKLILAAIAIFMAIVSYGKFRAAGIDPLMSLSYMVGYGAGVYFIGRSAACHFLGRNK